MHVIPGSILPGLRIRVSLRFELLENLCSICACRIEGIEVVTASWHN